LAKKYLRLADPERGRFRTFLLTALKHFVRNDWRKQNAQRRGGEVEIAALLDDDIEACNPDLTADPELIYDQQWASTLIERTLSALRAEYSGTAQEALFDKIRPFVIAAAAPPSYETLAAELNMSSGAIRVAVHRLRERYRELLRAEVANTVASPADIDDELRHLASVLRAQ
jgi:RNA polymerase sigma-70 factor (ECF subfamily)